MIVDYARSLLSLAMAMLIAGALVAADAAPIGLEEWSRPDLLPRFRPAVKMASFSSWDRTGGNDDGFSGKYSFIRKEGEALVVAEMTGPGCIYRIWTPTPNDAPMEFYFDGEAKPRLTIPFRKLFDGTQAPFTPPLSGFGGGGFYTYLPMPYRTSCKVVLRGPMQFYQINYATFAEGTAITTFSPDAAALAKPAFSGIGGWLASPGADLSQQMAPAGAAITVSSTSAALAPGRSAVLYESGRGGRLVGLRLGPAAAFAGKDRAVLLRITWDGADAPAVLVPAGDFFGYAWGEPAMRSALVGTADGMCYCWLPMPYDRSARVELVSEAASGPVLTVQAEIAVADAPRRPDEGRFHARWSRERPTREGVPFTFVASEGRGHLVGAALQAQGLAGSTGFFEGDDEATLDGELTIRGTGSEDFFNGGWYDVPGRWEGRASFPLSGCLAYNRAMGRSGGYRWFITDAYPFRKSLKLTIEHGPEGNRDRTDYAAVSYLYLERPPVAPWTLPPVADRRIDDPAVLWYEPGWCMSIHSFSVADDVLSRGGETLGGQRRSFLSLRTDLAKGILGDHHLAPQVVVPSAGRWRVLVEVIDGPAQGIVQLHQHDRAMGEPVDMYAPERRLHPTVAIGELDLEEGRQPVYLKIVGRNPQSSGGGLDLVRLGLERVR